MNFNETVENILNEIQGYPKLDKMIKKMDNHRLWDTARSSIEDDFGNNGENDNWGETAVKSVLDMMDKTLKISPKDNKILKDVLSSYTYILQTRGL